MRVLTGCSEHSGRERVWEISHGVLPPGRMPRGLLWRKSSTQRCLTAPALVCLLLIAMAQNKIRSQVRKPISKTTLSCCSPPPRDTSGIPIILCTPTEAPASLQAHPQLGTTKGQTKTKATPKNKPQTKKQSKTQNFCKVHCLQFCKGESCRVVHHHSPTRWNAIVHPWCKDPRTTPISSTNCSLWHPQVHPQVHKFPTWT